MLKLYDYLDEVLFVKSMRPAHQAKLKYYASEVMEKLGYADKEDYTTTLNRTFQICNSLGIPIKQNFRQVYRTNGNKTSVDYKISSIACYLLVINGDPFNPNVAKAQLLFASSIK